MKKNHHHLPHKSEGFILATIIVFLLFMLFMVLGSARLGILTQKYNGNTNDLSLAQNLANQAIFDSQNGAIKQIKTESNPASFTAGCINGLCTAPVSPSYSIPLYRAATLSAGEQKPCATYTLSNTANGVAAIPLIDIDNASGNGVYAVTYNSGRSDICAQPRYQIELLTDTFHLDTSAANAYVSGGRLYRVTSRGYGRNGNTQATRQAYFYVVCPNNVCSVSLLSSSWL